MKPCTLSKENHILQSLRIFLSTFSTANFADSCTQIHLFDLNVNYFLQKYM